MATLVAPKIKPGTTPTLTVIVEGEAIQDATVYVTIDMRGRHLIKTNYHENDEMTLTPVYNDDSVQVGTLITLKYTQSDTLYLRPGYARVEVGWIFSDGTADKSELARIKIPRTLFKGVMVYG